MNYRDFVLKIYYLSIFFSFLFAFPMVYGETKLEHMEKRMKEDSYFESVAELKAKASRDIKEDPISTYCGSDCLNCGFSQTKCMAVLTKWFKSLCFNQTPPDLKETSTTEYKALQNIKPDKNCFLVWQRLSKTCQRLCGAT